MENQSLLFELGIDKHIFDFYAKDPYKNIKLNSPTFYATLIFGFFVIINLNQSGNVICTQNAFNGNNAWEPL